MSFFSRGWGGLSALALGVFGAAIAGGITTGACALPGYSVGGDRANGVGGSGGGATTDGAGGKTGSAASSGGSGGGATSGGGEMSGAGGAPPKQCMADGDCGNAKPCEVFVCEMNTCITKPRSDGPLGEDNPSINPPGDCNVATCQGGHLKYVADPNDPPKDDNGCTNDQCAGPYIDHSTLAMTTCSLDPNGQVMGVCKLNGECIECMQPTGASNCQICIEGQCGGDGCSDMVKDGGETGVDCGGPCPGCAKGGECLSAKDCKSGVCTGGICQKESCSDDVRNGTEVAPDCGANSGCPELCPVGSSCGVDADCVSGFCKKGACQFTCGDGMLDGLETQVDCGGPICPPCGGAP